MPCAKYSGYCPVGRTRCSLNWSCKRLKIITSSDKCYVLETEQIQFVTHSAIVAYFPVHRSHKVSIFVSLCFYFDHINLNHEFWLFPSGLYIWKESKNGVYFTWNVLLQFRRDKKENATHCRVFLISVKWKVPIFRVLVNSALLFYDIPPKLNVIFSRERDIFYYFGSPTMGDMYRNDEIVDSLPLSF